MDSQTKYRMAALTAELAEIRRAVFGARADANRNESLPSAVKLIVQQRDEWQQQADQYASERDRLAAKVARMEPVVTETIAYFRGTPDGTLGQKIDAYLLATASATPVAQPPPEGNTPAEERENLSGHYAL